MDRSDEQFDGQFDGLSTAGWMRRFAESVGATEDELSELDQRVGDGDFGVNLAMGLNAVVRVLDRLPHPPEPAAAPLMAAGEVFLDEVGGTSGPLFGLLLQEMAYAADSRAALAARDLAAGADCGLVAIRRVGGAEPGDKTLVDALVPAVRALWDAADESPPLTALDRASQAAWEAVRGTARLAARRGRASYVGERASGVPDPGAVGVALLFSSAREPVTRLPVLD